MKHFLIFLILGVSLNGFAQVDTTTEHNITGTPIKTARNMPLPRVTRIQTIYASDPDPGTRPEKGVTVVYPGNTLRFTINNPEAFLLAKPTDRARVVMYANGVELTGICNSWYRNVTRFDINSGQTPGFTDTAYIDIKLRRNDTCKAAWNFFYSSGEYFYSNSVDVNASIGWEGMSPLEKDPTAAKVRVVYFENLEFAGWLLLYLAIAFGFFWFAVRTDALKERPGGPYSLSHTQLLFWTVLTIGGFIYTLVLTDIPSSFNSSILILLGISMGTAGGATAIDTVFNQANPSVPDKISQGFFHDILGDGKSFSIARLQTFAWNLVLGLYFILYTVGYKSMPVFSDTLLLLAGFSSVSYLGGKLPENIAAKKDAQS